VRRDGAVAEMKVWESMGLEKKVRGGRGGEGRKKGEGM